MKLDGIKWNIAAGSKSSHGSVYNTLGCGGKKFKKRSSLQNHMLNFRLSYSLKLDTILCRPLPIDFCRTTASDRTSLGGRRGITAPRQSRHYQGLLFMPHWGPCVSVYNRRIHCRPLDAPDLPLWCTSPTFFAYSEKRGPNGLDPQGGPGCSVSKYVELRW